MILYDFVESATDTDVLDVDIAIELKNTNDRDKMDRLMDLTVDMDLKYGRKHYLFVRM